MASIGMLSGENPGTVWPVTHFRMGDFETTDPSEIHLDSPNSEFGLFHRLNQSEIILATSGGDANHPVYFHASWAVAACSRSNATNKKISLKLVNCQIDLEFVAPDQAQSLLSCLKSLATTTFTIFEVPNNQAFNRKDFDMAKACYGNKTGHSWSAVPDTMTTSLSRLFKTGDWSDFSVIAGGKIFNVHRSILCPRSSFFEAACRPEFIEGAHRRIELEEDADTVETLLSEIYGVENDVTGSICTTFASKNEMEKEESLNKLLKLFIAADKYSLDSVKLRAARAIPGRLQLVHDQWTIVALARVVLHHSFPEHDTGLRKIVMEVMQLRLPVIWGDSDAKDDLLDDRNLVENLLAYMVQKETKFTVDPALITPPSTPEKHKGPGRPLRSGN